MKGGGIRALIERKSTHEQKEVRWRDFIKVLIEAIKMHGTQIGLDKTSWSILDEVIDNDIMVINGISEADKVLDRSTKLGINTGALIRI